MQNQGHTVIVRITKVIFTRQLSITTEYCEVIKGLSNKQPSEFIKTRILSQIFPWFNDVDTPLLK